MSHIFVSYAREDKAFVDKLATDLKEAGYSEPSISESMRFIHLP